MPVIQVEQLRKVFPAQRHRGELVAVDDISFAVEEGERLAYIGPNGAGKSTSIKMLTGILYPTSGSATVLDIVPWTHRKQLAHHIGTLFGQRSQLWFQLTPRQSYSLLARIYGLSRAVESKRLQSLGEILEANDLFDQPVRSLSLGQRMRCELVASLLHAPKLLFLDEPTIGLDLIAKARFRDLILRVNQEDKTTIFLTSHDVSDIEQVARRVIVINHGRLIYDDKVSDLRRSLLGAKVIRVLFAEAQATVDVPGCEVIKLSGAGATIEVDTEKHAIREVLDALLDRYPIVDISVSDPPLEEVIAQIYARPA